MKNTIILILMVSALMFSCKTVKKAETQQPAEPVSVQKIAEEKNDTPEEVITPEVETPIVIKTEDVSLAEDEDQSKEGFAFYVIIGSFANPENAANYKTQLIEKGFSPVLLNSESGLIRVAVNQTNSEQEARQDIMNIRVRYPKHKDVWLLKKK